MASMRVLAFKLAALLSAVSSLVVLLMPLPALASDRIELAFQAEENFLAEQASTLAVRAVIERQIDALRKDDAQAAFAFVAPRLKQRFADSAMYMRVIRSQFPAILTARIASFGDMRETSYGTAQMVTLSDTRGEP